MTIDTVDPVAIEALKGRAGACGIASERIIVAPFLPSQDHLARIRFADLALDCFPYGAHTTASDALWAGVPLIALMGDTFASRVSASILTAAGMSDLITTSVDGYCALAVRLANDRGALAEVTSRVRACRAAPLFDTRRFTRNLEAAYSGIWDRYRVDLPPDHYNVVEVRDTAQLTQP